MHRTLMALVMPFAISCSQGDGANLSDGAETEVVFGKQTQVCMDFGKRHVAEMTEKGYRDYANLEVSDCYSPTTDACIHTEVQIVGLQFMIEDISRTFIKEKVSGPVMRCSAWGANSAIIDSVNAYDGYVGSVRFENWLDDGYRGVPLRIQGVRKKRASSRRWTRADCKNLFDRWMADLRRPRVARGM